jgi:hypothetical protein
MEVSMHVMCADHVTEFLSGGISGGLVFVPVLLRKQLRELLAVDERPRVKPTLRIHRRLM